VASGSVTKSLETAARMTRRKIERLALGTDTDPADYKALEKGIARQIDGLYRRANQPEIRGDEAARERAHALLSAVASEFHSAASEWGPAARAAKRSDEIGLMKRLEGERRARDPALSQYQKELAVTLAPGTRRG